MAILNPIYYMSNRNGVPRIASTGVKTGTDTVIYSFSSDAVFSSNYSGMVLVKIQQAVPSTAVTANTIVFSSEFGDQTLTGFNGAPVTVGDFQGTGIYLCYYDRASNTLQVLTI